MSTRLDLALRKFPEHEEGIRLLAARDPSGNLKYLDWGARMLAAKQALATEVADVIDLFHQFRGRPVGRRRHHQHNRIHSDLYAYRPQDLARLRDALLKIKRATDKKRRERERLYRIEGAMEADVVYDSPDLTVRHIKNKQASLHYGLSTKWCISMSRERYFEEYESHNATFFFFERKTPVGDEFDKVAVMLPRGGAEETAEAFTSIDRRVDMMALAKVYGLRVFDIFRGIYERSEQYPGSVLSCVYAGRATQEQLEAVLASITRGELNTLNPYERSALLEAICCNDAAPPAMLEAIAQDITKLSTANLKRLKGEGRTRFNDRAKDLVRVVMAALVIHPQTPADLRQRLTKDLRRRHVDIDKVHRVIERGGRIGVQYREPHPHHTRYRRSRRRPNTVATHLAMAERFDRYAARARKKAKALQVKLAKKKKRGS